MSGIVGSKFNDRVSGLVGSLGTDGQHLLSSGAGKTNVFETVAAASSDFVLLSTTTGSGTVSFDGDFSATYDNYLLVGYNGSNDGADEDLNMRVRQANSDITGSSYYRVWNGNYGNTSSGQVRYDGAVYGADHIKIINNWDDAATKPTQFNMWIYDPFQGDTYHYITWHCTNVNPAGLLMNFTGSAHYYGNTTALSGLSFYDPASSDITTLELKLYGLK